MMTSRLWYEAEETIEGYKKEFFIRFGVRLNVYFSMSSNKNLPSIRLTDLYQTCNEVLFEMYPTRYVLTDKKKVDVSQGMLTKSRIRELATIRQVYFYFAKELGYGCNETARLIEMNHSTAIHSTRVILNGLEVKDKLITEAHDRIRNRLINKYGSIEQ